MILTERLNEKRIYDIKPLETRYNGVVYRSKLEACWAYYMDNIGLIYQYEPEGFRDGKNRYIPDFYIYGLDLYLEIKPTPPTKTEWDKALMASRIAQIGVCVGYPLDNVILNIKDQKEGPDFVLVGSHKYNNMFYGGGCTQPGLFDIEHKIAKEVKFKKFDFYRK